MASSGVSPLTQATPDLRWAYSGVCNRQSVSIASWRLLGLLSAMETGSGQVGVQGRERALTYLSSGVRMIETPDPANCASCPENYYSACPVQRTKGSCDRSSQQCPAQGGPGPAPIRPSLSYLLHPHPHHLSRALTPTTSEQAGRVVVPALPARPAGSSWPSLLAQESWPTLRALISLHKGGDGQCVWW